MLPDPTRGRRDGTRGRTRERQPEQEKRAGRRHGEQPPAGHGHRRTGREPARPAGRGRRRATRSWCRSSSTKRSARVELRARPYARRGARPRSAGSTACCSTSGCRTPPGWTALRRLAAQADGIALLVLTGLADEHRGAEAVAAGAQDYLVKGQVDGQLLTRAIRYAIGRSRIEATERALHEQQLHAEENTRLERGLLPSAADRRRRGPVRRPLPAGGRRLAARRRLLRRGPRPRRRPARHDRRRQRARPGRGRARRTAADRLARAGARGPSHRRDPGDAAAGPGARAAPRRTSSPRSAR